MDRSEDPDRTQDDQVATTPEAPPTPAAARELDLWGVGPVHGASTEHRGWWQRGPLLAREAMNAGPATVPPDASLREVADVLRRYSLGAVPVMDRQRRVVGLITDRDLVVRGLAAGRADAAGVMNSDLEPITGDVPVHEAVDMMARLQLQRLPVVDDEDRLIGVLSLADAAARADEDERVREALRRLSGKRSFWSRFHR